MKQKRQIVSLTTDFKLDLEKSPLPFSEYPRPQMKRASFLCLNGKWNFSVEEKSKTHDLGTILVPFPPESRLSGIERVTKKEETLIYSRAFALPDSFRKERVLLHFGAVDQRAHVFVNGKEAGCHEGGYLPFTLDITDTLKEGENCLLIRVQDPLDPSLPYGKQSKKPGGMWYTPVSGIWQTVWLESVPKNAIERLFITTTQKSATIRVEGGEERKKLILCGNGFAKEYHFEGDGITLALPDGKVWSPEEPNLYRFTLITGEDRVESYFALREISVETRGKTPVLCLNGKPYHFHGVLDQGYFPDGIYLPASPRGYREDILKMKEHGFNMLRKHIKIEPDLFYYECDRLGMAVFQDMVNCGSYSFLRDTALPTLGIKKGVRVKRSEKEKKAFLACGLGLQRLLYNHPSVLYYTIFNEGWGQFEADEMYELFKKEDPTRIYDTTSGWFFETKSDVDSHHIYFKKTKLPLPSARPTVLSEFGGYACKVKGHSFVEKGEYGYRFFKSRKAWEDAVIDLYEKEILPLSKKGLCATVLTQLSDVEEETNGLLTYDRKVTKGDPKRFNAVAKEIRESFDKFCSLT